MAKQSQRSIDTNALVGRDCTIDNRPARICGRLCDYAVIVTLDGKIRAEWAWSTAADIMARGGKFKF